MPTVHAGFMPGSHYKASPVSSFTRSGKMKNAFVDDDREWDLSTGWHLKRAKGWRGKAKYETRELVDTNGQKYKVHYYADRHDTLGFHAKRPDEWDADLHKMLTYAEHAFDEQRPDHENIIKVKGVGHITSLWYAEASQVMRVEFATDGAICLFFKVPRAVFGTLKHHAESGQTRADGRHLLGIEFWDYVRIRGVAHGSRYELQYEKHGSRSEGFAARENSRHVVELDYDLASSLFSDKTFFKRAVAGNIKPNSKITLVLNDEEYSKLRETNKSFVETEDTIGSSGVSGVKLPSYVDKDGKTVKGDIKDTRTLDPLEQLIQKEEEKGGARTKQSTRSDLKDYVLAARDKLESQLEEMLSDPDFANYIDTFKQKGVTQEAATRKALREVGENRLAELYSSSEHGLTSKFSDYNKKAFVRAAFGPGAYGTWIRKNLPAKYMAGYTGRVWTIQELKDFTNPAVPNNISLAHAATYKKLVDAKDWQGALNFLKANKTEVKVDSKSYGMQTYASKDDKLAMEE